MKLRTFLLLFPMLALPLSAADAPRERISFNAGWRFAKGDPADAQAGALDYAAVKDWVAPTGAELVNFSVVKPARPAGNLGDGVACAQSAFDDSGWRKLDLPHDWGIEGPFAQENPGDTGKLPWWGVAWYRKSFPIPTTDEGKRVFLDIDGAMSYSLIWCNGQFVGGWPYGYSSYRVELTPYLKVGGDNVLAIRLDNPKDSSRWYPGGGIYRNVWLVKTAPVHIAHWGVFVTTPVVTPAAATVDVKVTLDNATASVATTRVSARLYELGADGQKSGEPVVTAAPIALQIAAGRQSFGSLSLNVANPKLWSLSRPQRYVAVTTVEQGGKVVDME